MNDGKRMFDVVRKYFGDSPHVVTQFTGRPILRFSHEGSNGRWVCIAHCREADDRFLFYSIGLAATPVERRAALAEFITRANFGLLVGNFEMDMDDGEIRYKTSIDVEGDRLSTALLQQLVRVNLEMMDKYLPGLYAVANEGMEPLAAIVAVEGPQERRSEFED
ncbi:MAG: YbjN domain-containing protein [Dehalococcoidia bacterium]